MKSLFLTGMLLLGLGATGSGFAQTAAQYIAAGNQFYAAKDYTKGAQYYQAATQMDSNSAAAYQGLGNCDYLLGKNTDALTAYEKALSLNPNNPQLTQFVESLRAKVGAPPMNSGTPASTSPAATSPASSPEPFHITRTVTPEKTFELEPMAGVAIGMSGGYGLGFGGGLGGYFLMSGGLGIGGSVGYYTFGQSLTTSLLGIGTLVQNATWSNIEILGSVKYIFDGNGIKPYIKGGAGIDLFGQSATSTVTLNPPYNTPYYQTLFQNLYGSTPGSSALYPTIQAGGGIQIPMGDSMSGFAEVKYTLIIGSGGTASYLPINIGLDFGL